MEYKDIVSSLAFVPNDDVVWMKNDLGKRFPIAFVHAGDCYKKQIVAMIRDKHRCNECNHRIKYMCVLSNGLKPIFFKNNIDDQFHCELYKKAKKIVEQTPIIGIHVFQNQGYFEKHEGMLGGFHHYYMQLQDQTDMPNQQAELFQKSAIRYIPSILPNIIVQLFPDTNFNGLLKTLEVLNKVKTIIEKSTYGYHLLPSIEWMIRITNFCKSKKIVDIREKFQHKYYKWIFGCGFLFWTEIRQDGDHGAVSLIIQQVYNNILDMILSAHDENALQKMIENRMNPSQYMRPSTTKYISDNTIQQSSKKLGDFSNTIMTLEEASRLPFSIKIKSKSSSSEAYLKMMSKPKNSIHSFLDKCSIPTMKTMTDVFQYIEKYPNVDVKLCTQKMTPVYVAKTTLDNKYLSVPHLWAFMNHRKSSDFDIPEMVDVSLILPLYKYITSHKNIIFIIQHECNLKNYKQKIGNCCFPAFLNPTYQRELRNVFERLNTTMPININEKNNAFGFGTSVKNTDNKFLTPITLFLNNVKHVIEYL